MKKIILILGVFALLVASIGLSSSFAQKIDPKALNIKTKIEFHNYLATLRGKEPILERAAGPQDRKRAILNVGNVEARIRNSATLGYDRDGKCYEFPSSSGISYRWTMAPLVGYKKADGTKVVASGAYGAQRGHEDEFEPIGGLDAGWSDNANNYGIAASDRPDTWPSSWPTDPFMPPVKEISAGKGNWFPGILNGEVVATRELYFAVTDASNNVEPGNIRVDVWGIQYEDFINEDFIIFKMRVTNISNETLNDVYVGMHDDPDTPEQGTDEWTDDFAVFIPAGADVDGYTASQDSLLWNFSYLWDGDDRVEGLIASKVGWVGLKVLETPDNPNNPGIPMGLTTLDVFEYSMAPQTEEAEYDQLASGIKPPDNVEPHPDDWTQTANTYGPDITYVFASGPFTLAPGQSLNFALASVHGVNKKDLFNNAMLCQILYNNNYRSAEAPPEPNLRAVAGDHSVTLYWDAYPTEVAVYADGHVGDKLTGNNAFEGYKIYKSVDRGITWGEEMIDITGAPRGYIPLAQFDLPNGISGESETRPFFYLGDDTGLRHSYVDNNVENGYEYWYAVIAYDHDDGPVPPMENAFKKDAKTPNDNVIAVTPRAYVSGFKSGSADSAAVQVAGQCDIQAYPLEIIDPTLITGDNYEVSFTVTDEGKTFTVTNLRTNQTPMAGSLPVKNWQFYDSNLDNAPAFDGVRLKITDVEWGIKSSEWTIGDCTAEITIYGYYDVGTYDDYEIRWTGVLGDSGISDSPPLPFIIYNLTQDGPCSHYLYDNDESGDYSPGDDFFFVEPDGNWTWDIEIVVSDTTVEPEAGDVLTILTNKALTAADKYEFSTTKETFQFVTKNDLSKITTVPNPFVVSSIYEIGAYGTEKEVQFHQLPPQCTIRIYNIAGDLIRTIEHTDGTPLESWNLQSYNQQEVSFGVYFYHVDAPGIGEYIGKMAVIK